MSERAKYVNYFHVRFIDMQCNQVTIIVPQHLAVIDYRAHCCLCLDLHFSPTFLGEVNMSLLFAIGSVNFIEHGIYFRYR
jgi:hypothetical protein